MDVIKGFGSLPISSDFQSVGASSQIEASLCGVVQIGNRVVKIISILPFGDILIARITARIPGLHRPKDSLFSAHSRY